MDTINIKGQSYNLTYNQDKIDFTVLQTALIDNNWAKDKENYTFYTFITCKKTTYKIFADCSDGSIKITEKISNVDDYYPWSELEKENKLVGITVNSVDDENDEKWLSKKEVDKIGCWLTFDAEGQEGSISYDSNGKIKSSAGLNFSRIPHCPGNTSGLTIGRGFDLKERNGADVKNILTRLNTIHGCKLLNNEFSNWLIQGCQKMGKNAQDYIKRIDDKVNPKNSYISRKQQYFLFKEILNMKSGFKAEALRLATTKAIKITPDEYEDKLPIWVKDILIDLRYRGDNDGDSRAIFMPSIKTGVKTGNYKEFKKIMNDSDYWMGKRGVPKDRFDRRKNYANANCK